MGTESAFPQGDVLGKRADSISFPHCQCHRDIGFYFPSHWVSGLRVDDHQSTRSCLEPHFLRTRYFVTKDWFLSLAISPNLIQMDSSA